MNIVAMIPARIGSSRLPMKNLALLGGRPMISYVVESAKQSDVFSRVVVNADDLVFKDIALEGGAEFYLRPKALGSSETKSDQVVYDFMSQYPAEAVAWVNSTAPLQTSGEIKDAVNYFIKEDLDSLITVKDNRVHAVFENRPINFCVDEEFARTQDLTPVQTFVYSIMMWRSEVFMRNFKKDGHALLSGKVGYYPVSKLSSMIVKTEEDLRLIESLLKARGAAHSPVQYFKARTKS